MSTGYSGGNKGGAAQKGTTGTDEILVPILCVVLPVFLPVMFAMSFFGERERGRQMRRLVYGAFLLWSLIWIVVHFLRR